MEHPTTNIQHPTSNAERIDPTLNAERRTLNVEVQAGLGPGAPDVSTSNLYCLTSAMADARRVHPTSEFSVQRSTFSVCARPARAPAFLLGAPALLAENRRVSSTTEPAPPVRVHSLAWWQFAILWPLGLLLRLWARTLRFEVSPEDRAAFDLWDQPVALVIWHNRLFISGEIIRRCRRGRTFYGLISASKDGAWLAAFFRMLGISAVRGSSSRGAREAVTALIDVLRSGRDIGITPDGPRGPRYEFKPGGYIVARRTNAPMLLIGAEFSRARHLRSWDAFIIPWPFSRVRIRCERVVPDTLPRDREEALAELTRVMMRVNGENRFER